LVQLSATFRQLCAFRSFSCDFVTFLQIRVTF
jgi:hypothetical protein